MDRALATRLSLTAWAIAALLAVQGCHAEPAQATAPQTPTDAPDGRLKVAADKLAPGMGGRDTVLHMLDVGEPMTFGSFLWDDRGVPDGRIWVRVDLSRQLISVFRGDYEIGTAVILYGGNGKPTPKGEFPVLQKARDYHSKTYDAAMPYMVRLTEDGVAIHASNVRPGWATHGCIGVPMEFAQHLFEVVKLGDRVSIS